MTTTSNADRTLDRADTETTLYRVAICAFTYYPDKPHDEAGYDVEEDVAWCAASLAALPTHQLGELRATIQTLVTDPGADRRAFIATLAELADE